MARAGSPRPTAVSAKTSRLTPISTGTSASTRRAAGSISSLNLDFAEGGQELGRGGERRALEPLDGGPDEGAARVMVERDPEAVVEQPLLGVLVDLRACGAGRHRVGLVQEPVELRIAIARGVA